MRIYTNLTEAVSEIRRDLSKGFEVSSSRVQQRTGLSLKAKERMCYSYAIEGGIPHTPEDLVRFGIENEFKLFVENDFDEMALWLRREIESRIFPVTHLSRHLNDEKFPVPVESIHPALQSTIEGNYPSYTYPERMYAALEVLENILIEDPDSRRAFWPIFEQKDALRAKYPTRVPCSLGYQALIRRIDRRDYLTLVYLERSCDFDTFWLSDIWFARQFQLHLAQDLAVLPGQLVHFITSFHSFAVDGQEIY